MSALVENALTQLEEAGCVRIGVGKDDGAIESTTAGEGRAGGSLAF